MLETIRFYACAFFMIVGLLFEVSAVIGIFRFKYVLNRMHAGALGDTMGILFIMIGLSIANGFNMVSLKLIALVFIFWFASPVSSHMLGRLEFETNDNLVNEVKAWKH